MTMDLWFFLMDSNICCSTVGQAEIRRRHMSLKCRLRHQSGAEHIWTRLTNPNLPSSVQPQAQVHLCSWPRVVSRNFQRVRWGGRELASNGASRLSNSCGVLFESPQQAHFSGPSIFQSLHASRRSSVLVEQSLESSKFLL